MNKLQKIIGYTTLYIFGIIFVLFLAYHIGKMIAAIYVGDIFKVDRMVAEYSFLWKIFMSFLSLFFISWFGIPVYFMGKHYYKTFKDYFQ